MLKFVETKVVIGENRTFQGPEHYLRSRGVEIEVIDDEACRCLMEDFIADAWVPSSGPLAVLRALRVLRMLHNVSVVPQLRTFVGALITALPGMGSIVAVLMLVFYVAA